MQFRDFNLRLIINCLKLNLVNDKGTYIKWWQILFAVFDKLASANFQGNTLMIILCFFNNNFISLLYCVIEPKIFTDLSPEVIDLPTLCHNKNLTPTYYIIVVKTSKIFHLT